MTNDNRAVSPLLLDFAGTLLRQGHRVCELKPEHAAQAFRDYFDLPLPVTVEVISQLLCTLGYCNTFIKPYLEHFTDIRGIWTEKDYMNILISGDRPAGSRTKTVLHEVIEPLWEMYTVLFGKTANDKQREAWCNKFAAMIKMPPGVFGIKAIQTGIDLRALAEHFDDTLAGVSRQLRDISFHGELFYFCRFDVVRNSPKDAPPNFKTALDDSGGLCVRVVDVVKTPRMKLGERFRSEFPRYNLPQSYQYRIVHPSLRRLLEAERPLYIPRFRSDVCIDQTDLFGDNDLSVLIYHYGHKKNRGFFMLVTRSSDGHRFAPQLEASNPATLSEVDWLFRLECIEARKPRKPDPAPGLPYKRDDGSQGDLSLDPFPWPGLFQ